jgi:surfactin synthase thioesterase subunit
MEPLVSGIDVLVDDLYNQICKNIDQCEYAIYGHSMGGLVGYLVARKLVADNHRFPQHLFITGAPAPSSASRSTIKRHSLSDAEFMEELKKLDGVSDELLLNKDLFRYVGPILRADFKICEDFQYGYMSPLQVPITVITGTQEGIEMGDIRLWQKETEYTVDFIQLPGKHFFIFREPREIIEIISQKLCAHTNVYQL